MHANSITQEAEERAETATREREQRETVELFCKRWDGLLAEVLERYTSTVNRAHAISHATLTEAAKQVRANTEGLGSIS